MNPVALAVMASLLFGFLAVLTYAVTSGATWIVAVLAILLVGLFIRWR